MLDDYSQRDATGRIVYDASGQPVAVGSPEQQSAVAQLMKVCSASIQTKYGPEFSSGSGASDHHVLRGLYQYLGFPHVTLREQDYYGYDQWLSLLYDELRKAHAVFFTGMSTNGGHAFVIDGYDTDDLFSVNWGWSGRGNGYYRVSSLQPTDQGTGGAMLNDGFRYGQAFLSHFYPGAPALQPALYGVRMRSAEKKSPVSADGSFALTLSMSVKNLECVGGFEAEVGVAAVDEADQILCVHLFDDHHGGLRMMEYNKADTINKMPITFSPLPSMPSSYRLRPCFRPAGDQEWHLAEGQESILVRVSDDRSEVRLSHVANLSLGFADEAASKYDVEVGQPFEYHVRLKVVDGELHDGLVGKLTPPKKSGLPTVKAVERDVYFATKGTEFDVHFTFPAGSLVEGVYSLTLSTYRRDYDANLGSVTVTASSGIHPVTGDNSPDSAEPFSVPAYDMNGRPAAKSSEGLIVSKGRKVIRQKR